MADHKVKVLSLLPPIPAEVTAEFVAGQYGLPDCTIGETFLAEPVPTPTSRSVLTAGSS